MKDPQIAAYFVCTLTSVNVEYLSIVNFII